MNLSQRVLKFIEKEDLFKPSDHLLLAVSGGKDSMALLFCLIELKYPVQVAHINYGLRGRESEKDQELVTNFCQEHDIPLYIYRLSQEEIDDLKKSNLQEKARNIRYDYMNQICKEQAINYICTAHHIDDKIETALINLTRGVGLNGLTSLRSKHLNIRRPLLGLSQREIINYVSYHAIPFRTDHSNLSNDYDRNFIRNEIIASINKRIARAPSGFTKSLNVLGDEAILLKGLINKEKSQWLSLENQLIRVGPLKRLKNIDGHTSLLFHLINAYGYNSSDVNDILKIEHQNGTIFKNDNYIGVIHDDYLLIKESEPSEYIYHISEGINLIRQTQFVVEQVMTYDIDHNDSNVEYIDGDNIKFPLILRSWKEGDRFAPLGMGGKTKKVSDYYTDLKLNYFQKHDELILECNNQIIWLVNRRLDERFKIKSSTQCVYRISYS